MPENMTDLLFPLIVHAFLPPGLSPWNPFSWEQSLPPPPLSKCWWPHIAFFFLSNWDLQKDFHEEVSLHIGMWCGTVFQSGDASLWNPGEKTCIVALGMLRENKRERVRWWKIRGESPAGSGREASTDWEGSTQPKKAAASCLPLGVGGARTRMPSCTVCRYIVACA